MDDWLLNRCANQSTPDDEVDFSEMKELLSQRYPASADEILLMNPDEIAGFCRNIIDNRTPITYVERTIGPHASTLPVISPPEIISSDSPYKVKSLQASKSRIASPRRIASPPRVLSPPRVTSPLIQALTTPSPKDYIFRVTLPLAAVIRYTHNQYEVPSYRFTEEEARFIERKVNASNFYSQTLGWAKDFVGTFDSTNKVINFTITSDTDAVSKDMILDLLSSYPPVLIAKPNGITIIAKLDDIIIYPH